jgi:AraC-like DNA-binding protein
MQTTSQLLSSFAFLQMLMCSMLLIPYFFKKTTGENSNESIFLFIILMTCGALYLLPSVFVTAQYNQFIWWLSHIGGNALPGAFWLVSFTIFSEHAVLKTRHYFIASLTLIIPLASLLMQWLFSYDLTQTMTLFYVVKYGAMALELYLIGYALIIAVKYWRDDLVEQRRYIRGAVISLSAFYIIVVIVIEQLFRLQWESIAIVKPSLLLLLITTINLFLFKLRSNSLFIIDNKNNTSKNNNSTVTKKQSKELSAILDAMNKDLLYQQEGITISSFAKHLAIHEYKLRQLINGELNYRNFNDFLNFYRIKEVTEKLTQENSAQTPVLTLALESGFRSLSSFNKAFKDTHNLTPTQFRKKHLP